MAVIVPTLGQASAPDMDAILTALKGKLTLADVADSPSDYRYAVSSVNASNVPELTGGQMSNAVNGVTPIGSPTSATQVLYTNGNTVESLQPAQAGADVTGDHTSADTATVNGMGGSLITNGSHVIYVNGATIDSLQPAQKGADVTALNKALDTAAVNGVESATVVAHLEATYGPGANLLVNPSARLGALGWALSGGWGAASAGTDPNMPYFVNGTSAGSAVSSDIGCGANATLTVSGEMFTGGLTAGAFTLVIYANLSDGSQVNSGGVSAVNGTGWGNRYQQTWTTPANTVSVQVGFLLQASPVNTNCAIRRIKLEVGATMTPFNDDATTTAEDSLNLNGVAAASISPIAGLMPSEAGADVTGSHQSATTASLSNHTTADLTEGGTNYYAIQSSTAQQNAFNAPHNLLINGSAELGNYWWEMSSGWAAERMPGNGDPSLPYFINGTSFANASLQSPSFNVSPGTTYTLSAWIFTAGVTAGFVDLVLSFSNGSTYVGQLTIGAAIGKSWTYYQTSGPAPSGATRASVYVASGGGFANTSFAVRNMQVEVGTSATPYNAYSNLMGDLLAVAGSGQQIGDQRNLLSLVWASLRSVNSMSPITYTLTWNSAAGYYNIAFTVASYTLYNGANDPVYGATSGSGTQGPSETRQWFLFYNDLTGDGGDLALVIEQDPQDIIFNTCVLIGVCDITTPASGGSGSGTGSGGGGSGGAGFCVADDMFIRDGVRARDATMDTLFDCMDIPGDAGKHTRTLQSVEHGHAECVRLITNNGCVLECSLDTPFDIPDVNQTFHAKDMLGREVVTDLGRAWVSSVSLTGWKRVLRAHLGGVSYAAGADPKRRVYSHNAQGPEKP